VLSSLSLPVRTRKHTRILAISDTRPTIGNDRRHDHNPDCQSWASSRITMVILRRLSDWDYNPRSKDGLDYEDCQEVPALPDQEDVCSYTLYVPSQRCE
jgi:hypothetical protein